MESGPFKIGIACFPLIGGSGILATALGSELARRGHEIHFFSYAQPVRLELPQEHLWRCCMLLRLAIRRGSGSVKDLRKLATDANMKDDYVLHYQPDSIVVHGHWPALRSYYLQMCSEPLHRMHLQPTFQLPELNPSLLDRAFELFMDAYGLWAEKYGLEDQLSPLVSQYFEECGEGMTEHAPPGNENIGDPPTSGS